ncbi:hypothetical protein EPR50_G00067190 [Perca flavescens]|uniref:Uncharacterized protein n=1 Tax=Perca flavescens TaxID=8167 RepID=A0A484D9A7_PERFV|nr:hypothetical protein EPR50_G00067190 [Perca flavescens]
MALCRLPEEHLLMGVAQLDIRGGGVNPFIKRPAEHGLPEDEGEYEEGEYEIVVVDEVELFLPLSSDEEDDNQLVDTDQDEDEDTGDEDDWSDSVSEDSGYDSLSEDEEVVEEDVEEDVKVDDNGNIRPCSPLIQQFPPPSFWQRWKQVSAPVPAGASLRPRTFDVQHQEIPAQQVESTEDGLPSASQKSEESAPSTSGLGSSTKRSREESDTVQDQQESGGRLSFSRLRQDSSVFLAHPGQLRVDVYQPIIPGRPSPGATADH